MGDNQVSLKILVVEDNLINQKITKSFLVRMNHTVTIVNNGKEAVDIFDNEYFDCILMDIQMPIMDGIQATKDIREKEKTKITKIPIIAVSANLLVEEETKILEAGMNDFIPKPINEAQLINVLSNVINHNYSK
ncbi:MAG: response regulator [Bacteroidales bacterium]|nr:response regulator [Bacteroidales bacterium]